MPPISSDMFQYSTVMANGGKFATVFHQYWKTMAKNISGTWWHNCHRFSPICSNTPSSWQMMANDGQNATIFHSLYQSPVFSLFFTIDGNTHLSSFQYSIVFHRNRWHFYRRVINNLRLSLLTVKIASLALSWVKPISSRLAATSVVMGSGVATERIDK